MNANQNIYVNESHNYSTAMNNRRTCFRWLVRIMLMVFVVYSLLHASINADDDVTSSKNIPDKKVAIKVRIKDDKPIVLTAEDLSKLNRAKIEAVVDGKTMIFEGVPLSKIFEKVGMKWGAKCSLWLDCYVVIDSQDGYRSVFTVSDIDPGLAHDLIILADTCDGKPLRKNEAPYEIIEANSKEHGRWVKQVTSISVKLAAEDEEDEIETTKETDFKAENVAAGKIYLVGMGPGDAELVTIKAARILKEADCVFCFDYLKKEVARYAAAEKINVVPKVLMGGFWGQKIEDLPPDLRERAKINFEETNKFIPEIRDLVASGKIVVFADSGDPTMYCPWSWVAGEFADLRPDVVAGISSFNAANAALKQSITSRNGSILISPGHELGEKNSDGRMKGVLALFTHRAKFDELLPELQEKYPADTPIAVVCEASYPTEKVYRGTLATIQNVIGDKELPHLYLIYVGDVIKPDLGYSTSKTDANRVSAENKKEGGKSGKDVSP